MGDRLTPSLVEVIALAVWLGASAFFSVAVAPALFAALPSRALAGAVVGRLLPVVFYTGIAIGVLVIVMEFVAAERWAWRATTISSLVIIGACAVAQLVVAPRIERVRSEIGGSLDALPIDDARRVAFGRLHGASVAWLGIAMLAAVVAIVAAARAMPARQ